MKNMTTFGGFTASMPEGWVDVTDDLPNESPATLAKPDGIGALQFTLAKYQSGALPNVGIKNLQELLIQFGRSRDLGNPREMNQGCGLHPYVVADFGVQGELVRVWYLSNGKDVALITYVTQQAESQGVKAELRNATSIVESFDFSVNE
jgi:hypothetical protein